MNPHEERQMGRIRWRWELFKARSCAMSHAECAMGGTPGYGRALTRIYVLESHGLTRGWLKNRTVERCPEEPK